MNKIDLEKQFEYIKTIDNDLKRIFYFCALLFAEIKREAEKDWEQCEK